MISSFPIRPYADIVSVDFAVTGGAREGVDESSGGLRALHSLKSGNQC
jgi:hypothetical protein